MKQVLDCDDPLAEVIRLRARVAELEQSLDEADKVGVQYAREVRDLQAELAAANARAEAAERENQRRAEQDAGLREVWRQHLARAESEAAALRERISVEERARSQSETLLQQVGDRLDAVQQAAHAACRLWESHENHSLHEIRSGMRTLRDVLSKPAVKTEAADLRAEVERLRGFVTMASEAAGTLAADRTELSDGAMVLTLQVQDLKAEVERLRSKRTVGAVLDAETRLAAAEALLHEALGAARTDELNGVDDGFGDRLRAFLSTATQPAASAAPCTAEERAVLDAVADCQQRYLVLHAQNGMGSAWVAGVAEAELARRAAKEEGCTHPPIFVGPDGVCKSCGAKP